MNTLNNILTARATNKAAKVEVKTLSGSRNLLLSIADDLTITVDESGKFTTDKKAAVTSYPFPSDWFTVLKDSKRNPATFKAMAANVRTHHKTGSCSPYYILEAFSNAKKWAAITGNTEAAPQEAVIPQSAKRKAEKAEIKANVDAANDKRAKAAAVKAAKAAAKRKAAKVKAKASIDAKAATMAA